MIIWKQGQFYPELGKKVVELPNKVEPGPSDDMIKIDGFQVQPDKDGNYTFGTDGRPYTDDELDAINTYAVIRMVINMYEELLGRPIHWSWWEDGKGEPLLVKIRNNDINARFIKEYRCIELDYYGPYGDWTYNCRSVDLIAHETGHAILDSILPHLNEGNSETRGIGEAFCDLTAMFWILSQKDLCEYVIQETDGDLSKPSILSLFGVGHGYEDNQFNELRSALNLKQYRADSKVAYDHCEVLIGIWYGILTDFVKRKLETRKIDTSIFQRELLQWIKLIVKVYNDLDQFGTNFSNLKSIAINRFKNYEMDIKKHFNARNLL